MVQKYNVDPELAGTIPSLLPLGTLFLTPLFGNVDVYKRQVVWFLLLWHSKYWML